MKKTLALIGGGPANMILASFIDTTKYTVTIYEQNKALGRKFLVAGNGGFNLTHGSSIEEMKEKYIGADSLHKALSNFTNEDLRTWLSSLGIETYVGSSNRVFPLKNIKPIKVLQAIEQKIKDNDVLFAFEHEWIGFGENNTLEFQTPTEEFKEVKADIYVFGLGGASWKVTGSNDHWLEYFNEVNIPTLPFAPANCGFDVLWKKAFAEEFEGTPLKNIALTYKEQTVKGEIVITKHGIEGGAIYALSNAIRKDLENGENPVVHLNLKPTTTKEAVLRKLAEPKKKNSWSEHLIWKLKLDKAMFHLIKRNVSKEDFLNKEAIANILTKIPLEITGIAPIDEAISTVGGIGFDQLDEQFMLKNVPNTYCIGEMVDWDAPTGGYLLQGNFSMGKCLADYLNEKP